MNKLAQLLNSIDHDILKISNSTHQLEKTELNEEQIKSVHTIRQANKDIISKLDKFYEENKNKF